MKEEAEWPNEGFAWCDEPVCSCDECGGDVYAEDDDGSGLCDQCQWWADMADEGAA